MAATLPTVDPENLGTGLFSDFSPLLQLFGEETTKQFLATSMSWADGVLIAMAPIGIPTIVVSAIRISGYAWMKAIVGRARDSPDDEEKDLLSSTSSTTREIWNGGRVIRQTGECQTIEIVYYKPTGWELLKEEYEPGIWTLETALCSVPKDSGYFPRSALYRAEKDILWPRPTSRRIKPSEIENPQCESLESRFLASLLKKKKSPNLTLNIPSAIPKKSTVWLCACMGVVLQSAVFVINGLVVYHYRLLRGGYVIASYGYPTWASGTICISIGVCLCAWTINWCTTVFVTEPMSELSMADGSEPQLTVKKNSRQLCLVRLQKPIPSLGLPAYALFSRTNFKQRFFISQKTLLLPSNSGGSNQNSSELEFSEFWKDGNYAAIGTLFGTLFTLGGFILQNVGSRELHWSAGAIQLLATLILTIIRAAIRRHVGDLPDEKPLSLEPLFEATQLACKVRDVERFELYTSRSGFTEEYLHSTEYFLTLKRIGNPYRLGDKGYFPSTSISIPEMISQQPISRNWSELQVPNSLTSQMPVDCFHLLESHRRLLEMQTGSPKVHDIAARVYNALSRIFEAFKVLVDNEPIASGIFEWSQLVSVRRSPGLSATDDAVDPVDGLMKVDLVISSPSYQPSLERFVTLLDFSVYYYSKLKAPNPVAKTIEEQRTKFLRVLGFETQGSETQEGTKEIPEGDQLLWIQGTLTRKRSWIAGCLWIRQEDGQIRLLEPAQQEQGDFEGRYERIFYSYNSPYLDPSTLFCMSYSAISPRGSQSDHVLKGDRVEYFGVFTSEQGLLGAFAYDLVATCLLELVRKYHERLEKGLKGINISQWKMFSKTVFTALYDQKIVFSKYEAGILVSAAFAAHELFPDPDQVGCPDIFPRF